MVEQEFYGQMLMLNIAEDFRKEANEGIEKKKENGYKYDYQVNMNTLIGLLRERFILILLSMAINNDEKSQNGVRIDIWTHLTRECIINYVH